LCGYCVGYVWVLCGLCVGIVWVLCGLCVGIVWAMCGYCPEVSPFFLSQISDGWRLVFLVHWLRGAIEGRVTHL